MAVVPVDLNAVPLIQAAQYSRGGNLPINRIVIHDMEAAETATTAEAVARMFATTTRSASAHYNVDNNSIVRSVADIDIAYHAPPNTHSIGIEHAGYASQRRDQWLDDYSRAMLHISAGLTRALCDKYQVPIVFLTATQLVAGRRGITTHAEVSKAWRRCVAADTPILCRDLVWRPAGDLLPGDELIAFDESAPNQEGRRFRNATVTANRIERDTLLAIHTARGTVRCNYQHPWLTRRAKKPSQWGRWEWVEAQNLEPHDQVMHLFEPWQVDRSWESGWLAGMFDGEGWFTHNPKRKNRPGPDGSSLGVCQRESETADRLARAMKERTGFSSVRRVNNGLGQEMICQFVVQRRTEIMHLLGTVRPPRLLSKAQDFWVDGSLGKSCERVTVDSIEPVGTGFIANLATSTRTYIAAGFAMHNTDHWDPGPSFPMDFFLALVTDADPHPRPPVPPGGSVPASNAPFATILVHPNGGYLEIGEDGGVWAWGGAPFYGSLGNLKLNQPIVDAAWAPDHLGYYLIGKDGGIFAFGSAKHAGNALWGG